MLIVGRLNSTITKCWQNLCVNVRSRIIEIKDLMVSQLNAPFDQGNNFQNKFPKSCKIVSSKLNNNKTGTSKVGAISKAQRAQFLKPVKGGPFGLFENPVCCKISNKLKGDPLETKKFEFSFNFQKKNEK